MKALRLSGALFIALVIAWWGLYFYQKVSRAEGAARSNPGAGSQDKKGREREVAGSLSVSSRKGSLPPGNSQEARSGAFYPASEPDVSNIGSSLSPKKQTGGLRPNIANVRKDTSRPEDSVAAKLS